MRTSLRAITKWSKGKNNVEISLGQEPRARVEYIRITAGGWRHPLAKRGHVQLVIGLILGVSL